jgi:putative DNA primase/helicase
MERAGYLLPRRCGKVEARTLGILAQRRSCDCAGHADVVGASLQGIAAAVRVIELPGLPPKGDIIDWIKAGGTREKLDELLRQAKPWTSDKADKAAGDHEQQRQKETAPEVLNSVRASAVTMAAIDWLWPGRFAIGKLGLVVGLPDEGKGQVLCYIAAQVTHGGLWPCEEGRALQGNVILLTAEDDLNDTVVPRLVAAGADLDRVEIVSLVRRNNKNRMFSLITDLELLRQKVAEVGDVKMIQIDPISAYLGVGKVDSFRTADVRSVLGPLIDLAGELRVAIVGILHFNKKIDVTNALRISNSLALRNSASCLCRGRRRGKQA